MKNLHNISSYESMRLVKGKPIAHLTISLGFQHEAQETNSYIDFCVNEDSLQELIETLQQQQSKLSTLKKRMTDTFDKVKVERDSIAE